MLLGFQPACHVIADNHFEYLPTLVNLYFILRPPLYSYERKKNIDITLAVARDDRGYGTDV